MSKADQNTSSTATTEWPVRILGGIPPNLLQRLGVAARTREGCQVSTRIGDGLAASLNSSLAQAPRSLGLQPLPQNGRYGLSVASTCFSPHAGQRTIRGRIGDGASLTRLRVLLDMVHQAHRVNL